MLITDIVKLLLLLRMLIVSIGEMFFIDQCQKFQSQIGKIVILTDV